MDEQLRIILIIIISVSIFWITHFCICKKIILEIGLIYSLKKRIKKN